MRYYEYLNRPPHLAPTFHPLGCIRTEEARQRIARAPSYRFTFLQIDELREIPKFEFQLHHGKTKNMSEARFTPRTPTDTEANIQARIMRSSPAVAKKLLRLYYPLYLLTPREQQHKAWMQQRMPRQ